MPLGQSSYLRSNARRTAYYVGSTTRTHCYVLAVMPVCRGVYERLESSGFGMAKWQRYHDRQDRGNFANYLLQRQYLVLHITGGSGSGLHRDPGPDRGHSFLLAPGERHIAIHQLDGIGLHGRNHASPRSGSAWAWERNWRKSASSNEGGRSICAGQ